MPGELLRIGELAARADVTTRTVDHYTRIGLLVPAERSGGNYRLYRPADVDRIALIRKLEAHGVSLDDIAAALTAPGANLPAALDRVAHDLRALQAAADTVAPEAHGLLAAITARVHSLINLALHIPPDLFLP
ncbi:MerR family transcriptional regulator [Actinokineospora sp. UTMC 2448]|uniref:helix-turn-helix domain-containing protein n=1 Tax=Actinokineospora sp. UTMC 2448 TaxID=2268449 RepID=UPI0021643BB3|nr:MerR family transcriptional regulator [Actinokineospora sp. UTMC 2448]UVS78520.1 HTH-type transcriptional activator TipA [Actinokineospora sp. UTMC 2448]